MDRAQQGLNNLRLYHKRGSQISLSWFSGTTSLLIELEFGDVEVVETGNPVKLEKNPWSKNMRTNNNLNQHMAPSQNHV